MSILDQKLKREEVILPTHIECWPQELHDISIRSQGFALSAKEAMVLGSCITDWGEAFDLKGMSPEEHRSIREQIENKLEDLLTHFPDGAFVRLGSRSPKDAWLFSASDELKKGRVRTARDAFTRLIAGSERVYEDLQMAQAMGFSPWIWGREWVDLEPWQEFRCFSFEGKLAGVSQYDYRAGRIEGVAENAEAIMQAIREFHEKKFLPACHMDPIIFDVFVVPVAAGGYEVKLLEINPYFWLTDPCLFDWRQPEEFQGQFLFCTEKRVVPSGPDEDEDEEMS